MSRVALRFGLPLENRDLTILEPFDLLLPPGSIIALSGPSGSGKSTALRMIERHAVGGHSVNRVTLSGTRSVIDSICPNESLDKALELLGACGLGETPLWIRSPAELSDGQRFRARLARAVGMHLRGRSPSPLVCDEFCSGLHRRLAKAVAFNLRKLVSRYGLSLVLATADDDLIRDLQPDTLVTLLGGGRHHIRGPLPRRTAVSFRRRLVIQRGTKGDYNDFAAMHYRATGELGFVDKVFVMREGKDGQLLGIVVYSHGPLELRLRNQATDGRFVRRPKRLNREMRILRRLVVHPDVRGCGLGHWLVRKTLPQVQTPFVECLAGMGAVNPVFEKAGMTRVGTCRVSPDRALILSKLYELEVDPFAREFVRHVARRPCVRRLVSRLVYKWYQATTGGGEKRVERQSAELLAQTFRGLVGCRPVYFLWRRPRKVSLA